jgi:uncharacterized damage-inducible protein DinB
MSHKENWLEKQFKFDFPARKYLEFLQFLRETPIKIENLIKGLSHDTLIKREADSWSIQENVGHFLTSESLFLGRLDDYENDVPILRPARFEDNPTDKANFNELDIHSILDDFRTQREIYINRLEALELEEFGRAILHPRLNKPMRLCDQLYFHSEHDRHHLNRISELVELWQLR